MKRLSSEQRTQWILGLRRKKRLHGAVEDRLVELLKGIAPDCHPIKEPVGLAGGRNDLMVFEFSGKKVLFEVFATKSQVSRDLRILDKTDADVKIAIIVDEEADGTVLNAFLRQNPESNYPYLFIGELFNEPPLACKDKLRELVWADEEATFRRMLRAKMPKADFLARCREQGIEVISREDIEASDVTFAKVFVTVVLNKCLRHGVARERVLNLGQWLSDANLMKSVLHRVGYGLHVFLYTDFVENFGLYSDTELVDWIRASYRLPEPRLILSLNAVIDEIEERYLKDGGAQLARKSPAIYLGSCEIYEATNGRTVVIGLPRDTKSIVVVPPMDNSMRPQAYLEMVRVLPSGPAVVKIVSDEGNS